jgi:hypothetical protein
LDRRIANVKKQAPLGTARRDDNCATRRLRKAIAIKANTEAKLAKLQMKPLVYLDTVRDLRAFLADGGD